MLQSVQLYCKGTEIALTKVNKLGLRGFTEQQQTG